MQEEKFKVRAFGYGELAQLYFPSISKKSAAAQLRRWIRSTTVLPKLENLGYRIGNRLLTPAQVNLIVDEFGEP